MKRVLVVEDEYGIRDLITLNLEINGYEVTGVESAEHAKQLFDEGSQFDVVLLDIMLPGKNGIDFCTEIRKIDKNIGIIMLTAKSQETDKISGFASGADDYVVKPFSVGELTARVDAVYRRTDITYSETMPVSKIVCGEFSLDSVSRTVSRGDYVLDLTQIEYSLMELFLRNPGVALKRDFILKSVWGESFASDYKIVDVNVCRLRNKLGKDGSEIITTVWGFGYRWTV